MVYLSHCFVCFIYFEQGTEDSDNSLMQSAAVSGQSGRFCSGFYWKQVPMVGILSNLFLWSALRGMWVDKVLVSAADAETSAATP